jgi:hypothetical protein
LFFKDLVLIDLENWSAKLRYLYHYKKKFSIEIKNKKAAFQKRLLEYLDF